MARLKLLLRCVAEAVCAHGVRGLAGVVPFGDVVYDVARDAWERLRDHQRDEDLHACWEAMARADLVEVKEQAEAVVVEVAGDQPETVRVQLAALLIQVPALVRRSLRRPDDPTGSTVPPRFAIGRPEDLLEFLPTRLPRFQPGDRPAGIGDWELAELLGTGGFGEVWKARHLYFDGIAPVALKFCLDPAARDQLLTHEARVLNRVMRQGRHPGIVQLLDASLGTDPPCLKYEYIEGGDLAGLVRDGAQESPRARCDQATRLVGELAEVVGFAHRLSPPIVHRDLKPANVLVQRRDDGGVMLRVTDFGIGGVAALPALREARRGTTTHGELAGTAVRGAYTPLYASPQQMRGEPPDPRDDVHALGVIWYQLLTGDLASGSPTGLWAEELEEMGLARDLIRLLGACVSPRSEKRPADAAELAERLAGAARPVPVRTASPPTEEVRDEKLRGFLQTGKTGGIPWLLDLTNRGVGDEGLSALARSPRLTELSQLILAGNLVGDDGIKALAASPHAANLSKLVLWDNRVGDEGLTALAGSPYLSNLTTLDVGKNRIGDEGVIALAGSPYLAGLGALILVSNHVGDAGARALASSPYLEGLAELKPLDNRITSAGVSALRDRFGKRVRIY